MTDEQSAMPAQRPVVEFLSQLPTLPRHPRLFMLAYWLTLIVGTGWNTGPSSATPLGLLGRALLGTGVVLLVVWAWQIAQYASRFEASGNDQKKPSHAATALALLSLGYLIVVLVSISPPAGPPGHPPWIRAASPFGGFPIFGLLGVAAWRLTRAERALGLPTLGWFWTFALLCYSGLSASFVSRRLMKVAGAANARGYQTRN